VPGRVTQRVHTTVEVEDGQTFVIGGLIQRESFGTTRKVPVLGDLPFVGTAFRSIGHDERERELVVMVTVHLVDPLDCSQLPKYLPGQETRNPDDFELFLEGILEAPRGSRTACGGGNHYLPAYKNSPSAGVYPCAGDGYGGCGGGSCPTGGCNGYGSNGGLIGVGATGQPSAEVTPVGSREVAPPPLPAGGARPSFLPVEPPTAVDGQR
jgi:pilus assembly protein CpaC